MIPLYTLSVLIGLILTLFIDYYVLKTRLIKNKKWWLYVGVLFLLHTIVDNYLNGRWWMDSYIVGPYKEGTYSGINIIETPLENYGFGFAMMLLVISIFEYLESKKLSPNTTLTHF